MVDHEAAKVALVLTAVDPRAGGVALLGGHGTCKSTLARSLRPLLPRIETVRGSAHNADPKEKRRGARTASSSIDDSAFSEDSAKARLASSLATEIRDVGQAMARRAWADTRQGQFWQEGESHFESHHGEIKEESNEDLTALLAKLKAELETVDGKIHALRAEGVGADIPDTLKLPEMDPEPELQTECADAACLTVDVA